MGLFASYKFITSSLHFNINEVNWFGHQRLSTEDLSSWVWAYNWEKYFQLDLNKVSQKLAKHPWVKTASARRVFPQGLHIELKERIPFARVKLDQAYVMDNYGILLGPEEESLMNFLLLLVFRQKTLNLETTWLVKKLFAD